MEDKVERSLTEGASDALSSVPGRLTIKYYFLSVVPAFNKKAKSIRSYELQYSLPTTILQLYLSVILKKLTPLTHYEVQAKQGDQPKILYP